VKAGSTYSNSGGTLHSAKSVIKHEGFSPYNFDYDVALVQVCISFNGSIYNEKYSCDNLLYLTLLPCKMQFF
jgi:hypothetical protein